MISTVFSIIVLAFSQVITPAPATPATLDDWPHYPCQSGVLRLDALQAELHNSNLMRVVVPGELACSADPEYRFAVSTFIVGSTHVLVPRTMLGPYASVGMTTFHASMGIRFGQTLGVCLMATPQTPLSCAKVAVDPDGVVAVKDIDLAYAPVSFEVVDVALDPECNTCWIVAP